MNKILKKVAMLVAAGSVMCGIVGMPKVVKADTDIGWDSYVASYKGDYSGHDLKKLGDGGVIEIDKNSFGSVINQIDIAYVESGTNKATIGDSITLEVYSESIDKGGKSNGSYKVRTENLYFGTTGTYGGESAKHYVFVINRLLKDNYDQISSSKIKLTISNDHKTITIKETCYFDYYWGDCTSTSKKVEKKETESAEQRAAKQEAAKAQQAAITNFVQSNPELQAQIAQAMAANPYAGEGAAASIIYAAIAEQSQMAYADYMASCQNMYEQMMANWEQMLLEMQNGAALPIEY